MGELETTFLEDGAQSPETVVAQLVEYMAGVRETLDVAIYDFHASQGATAKIADALEAAQARGVRVRVVFNVDRNDAPSAPRPPLCDADEIAGLDVPTRGVDDQGALMHHKFIVRDGRSVWTGSTNWTEDAFSREENAILTLDSPEIAAAFAHTFEQLWAHERVESSGGDGTAATLAHGVVVTPTFSPRGRSMAHLVADRIGEARRRVRILSPVVTAGPVLGTLAEFAGRDQFDLAGAYDATQMREVQHQWAEKPWTHWKIEAWKAIAARLSGKLSTPYRPGSVHDYMHAKVVVADDEVLTGSYNLSRGGEENAENLLHIVSEPIALRFAEFADRVAARYRAPVR